MSNKTKKWVGKIFILLALSPIKLALAQASWWFVVAVLLMVGVYLLLNSNSQEIENES